MVKQIKITDLNSSEYRLSKPLDVIIEHDGKGSVLVLNKELEVYGDGGTDLEAINDFKVELIEFYKDLKDVPEYKLGKYPKLWQELLNTLIINK